MSDGREVTVFTIPRQPTTRRVLSAHWAIIDEDGECIALFLYRPDAEYYITKKNKERMSQHKLILEEVHG